MECPPSSGDWVVVAQDKRSHSGHQPALRTLNGEIDPTFIVTHRLPLSEATRGYELFKNRQEDCLKVVLEP